MRPFLLRWCYTLFAYLALPFMLLRLLWRSRRQPAYRQRWRERLGWYARAPWAAAPGTVIFHAVSVGEVHAARALVEAFCAARPDLRVVLTCSTPTGSARVRELFGDTLEHVYLPWDLPDAVGRFMARYRPQLLVLLETELWPNLLHACARQDCLVVLANARLSERSRRGYARIARLTHEMLGRLTLVAAQAPADGERFLVLGLAPERLCINGSLKFDYGVNGEQQRRADADREQLAGRPVWIAASTREGEDPLVLEAFVRAVGLAPHLMLVLVPRHPERFMEAAALAEKAGLRVQRASRREPIRLDTHVLVGDTMGELGYYYGLADVAFVGGSLVDTGCQNVIEPAALGLAVVIGPSRYNFQAVTDELLEAQALTIVQNPAELAEAVLALLDDTGQRGQRGARGRAVVARNQGATARLNERLLALLDGGGLPKG